MPPGPTERHHESEHAEGAIVGSIAREVVRIHARHFGRGPTKAKAVMRDDSVVVVLEEVFTKAEELLVEAGHFDQVRNHRQLFQDQVEPLFRNVVEQATGRTVRAFLSQVSPEGVGCEVFVLEPFPQTAEDKPRD